MTRARFAGPAAAVAVFSLVVVGGFALIWSDIADLGQSGPGIPSVTSPAEDQQAVGTSAALGVLLEEGGSGPADVTFYGRRVTGTERFTVAVLPDTQFYSKLFPATFAAQTDWVVQNHDGLNIEFVAHVGDLVQSRDRKEQEWVVADEEMSAFDEAGIPFGVVPGNHDLTPDGTGLWYDEYFSPKRFAGRPWYLGYLGDSISGVEQGVDSDKVGDAGIDRLNKDSYQVIQVGSLRLVFIGLEYDMPRYSLDWAQRVIDVELRAHPETEFVLLTHNFLDPSGERPTDTVKRDDGTSAQDAWDTLVKTNCSIRFVLSGHYSGEARRTNRNDCGQPVHQILADYQGRARGGSGWLRYMTFHPRDDEVKVSTYSPTLGRYESDDSSRFTLPFAMATPRRFHELGTVESVEPGDTAHLDWKLRSQGDYEWYAVVTDPAGRSGRSPTSTIEAK